jgi:hypothetical protein
MAWNAILEVSDGIYRNMNILGVKEKYDTEK